MVSKKGSTGSEAEGRTPSEEELAQVTPRDLYPTSDIRFVLVAIGRLESKVDRLIEDGKDLDKKTDAVKDQVHCLEKEMRTEIHALDRSIHGFKMGAYIGGGIIAFVAVAFWYLEGDRIMAVLKPPPQAAVMQTTPQPSHDAANNH